MYLDVINHVLDLIEAKLTEEISYRELAQTAAMSVYELRRIFAFIVGTPLSDYIRKRRLTCALFDLQSSECTITEIAEKYRYDSPSSFSRAFREMQGISPSEARRSGEMLTGFPRASFSVTVSGASEIKFSLNRLGEMKLVGYTGLATEGGSGCGEEAWNRYYDSGFHDRLLALNAFEAGKGEFAAFIDSGESEVSCTIGALISSDIPTPDGMDELRIPPALWGIFDVIGTLDDQISNAYYRTVTSWLGASPYERDPEICNLECFPVEQRSESADMKWKIYYPLTLKQLIERK